MREATKEEQASIDKYVDSISERVISISVIEDIKAEINKLVNESGYWQFDRGLIKSLEIIDKHTSRKDHV